MSAIKVAFASGREAQNARLTEHLNAFAPELPLYTVAEFAPAHGRWVPYNPARSFWENLSRCRASFAGKRIAYATVLVMPGTPHWRMRLMALLLAPRASLWFNENLDHIALRPGSAATVLRHVIWRARNFLRFHTRRDGTAHRFFQRLARKEDWHRRVAYAGASLAGVMAAVYKGSARRKPLEAGGKALPDGISVVVPSRSGKDLLARLLPRVVRELDARRSEIIVVDNGSDDGTAAFLEDRYPQVFVECCEVPLSFARAVNRGIRRARFSHVCLLNNNMEIGEGFFARLREAFDDVPELFCATAQVLFPAGAPRQETGKAVMHQKERHAFDFPIRCELPLPGEDVSYVLYGSGGCSLYALDKLRALGGLDEIYEPAYVEDLDLCYRAWQQGWPTVFAAGARVLHQHRATTSRFYSEHDLEVCLELNYLRFLASAVSSARVFRKLWSEAVRRLDRRARDGHVASLQALASGWRAPGWLRRPARAALADEAVLALGSGAIAVFPGRRVRGKATVVIAAPFLPFPLSHGGAVRVFNLMARVSNAWDQVLVAFVEELAPPPAELLELCAEIVLVRRVGSHLRPRTSRPDQVEEFDLPAFHGALRQAIRKWRPAIAQLELTHMAQFASDCAPARTILVEHDVTFDLIGQYLQREDDWEARREYRRWLRFETEAWEEVDCVVAMSETDRKRVRASRAVCLPNGVDLERYRPSGDEPERARILFIGSFAHLPNLLAVEFFLRDIWPRLKELDPHFHVIAGARHRYYMTYHQHRVGLDLAGAGIEVEDFISDVRPAYERATVVIAPLVASAGSNIKVLEAMAMGKAVVSTPAGLHGLDLNPGRDVVVAADAEKFAAAIADLVKNPQRRCAIEREARAAVEHRYGWDAIARRQEALYASLAPQRLAEEPARMRRSSSR